MVKLTTRLFILLLAVTLLAACSSNKRKVLKPVKLEPIHAEIKVDTLWSKNVGKVGKFYHQFALATDAQSIYAASAEGKIFKFDKLTGKKQWKVSLKSRLTAGVAVDAEHVYFAAIDGAMIALDKKTGEQVWSFDLDSELVAAPAVRDGHLVFQTVSGETYNLNTRDGMQRWREASNVPALTLRGNSTPVFFADFVVVGLANGRIALFDLNTGELRWEPRIALPKGESEIERLVDIDGGVALAGDVLYAATYQGQLAALSLSQGNFLWTEEESSYHSPALGMGNVYVSNSDAIINAYNQRTGDVKWSQTGLLRRKANAPSVLSTYVAVADYKGYIHLLSQVDGRFVARKRIHKSGVKATILVEGERFYVLANNGRLKAYQLGKSLTK